MLRRRGRLTYRTLKRQFELDDEALDDLREELVHGRPKYHHAWGSKTYYT